MDLSKKIFWWGVVGLIILRFVFVLLLMHNIPFTDMQLGGFRPHFVGSYWPDELHYFQLAESFAKLSPVPNVANLGYPLFLAPIIYFTGAIDPIGISKIVFIIQAFLFFSLAIILVAFISLEILKNRKLALLAAALFSIYPYLLLAILRSANFPRWIPAFHYQMWVNIGADYLSAVLLYWGFYLFIKKYHSGSSNLTSALTIGAIIAAASLTRLANILYLPLIFLILCFIKKYRESFGFGIMALLVYLPQWIYNFYFFGSPFTYGYRIQELSGHGSEVSIFGGWLTFNNIFIFFDKIGQNLPILTWILPIFILVLILGFLRLFKQEKISALLLAFWTLLNIGFYIFFVAAQSQLRYFIPSIPPLIILFISGIMKIYEFRRVL